MSSGRVFDSVKRLSAASGAGRLSLAIAAACLFGALLFGVAIASGQVGGPESATGGGEPSSVSAEEIPSPPEAGTPNSQPDSSQSPPTEGPVGPPQGWVSTHDLVLKHEALPCTGPEDPINFEIFSAGPEIAGLPMTATVRRCDIASPPYEAPANRLTYIYGRCEITPEDESGCVPPLEIQTWPACQRSIADYSFEGKPLPHKGLPKRGGAEVVEFSFALENRVEVYTKSSTVVIFASTPELAQKAVESLTPQQAGQAPITNPADLQGAPPARLEPPTNGAMEGKLPCQF